MPKYNIAKVVVHWAGRGTEDFKNVELIAPFLPSNDGRTKELLKAKFPGCKLIGGVHSPVTKID